MTMVDGDSIQIDKGGYVRVHYAIFELLAKAPLRGQQFRCLMFLFRKTYGFNKKEESISLQQWADGTGMRRQNVWRELQLLIKCNVIYMKSSGLKRPNIWGFNKRHETWNLESVITDDDKSVIAGDDKTVITDDYSNDPSVITSDDKSVITPHEHTKDSKDKLLAAAATSNESDEIMALARQAYATVGRIAPSTQTDDGRAVVVTAAQLVELYGYPACIQGLSTLKERNEARVRKNVRDTIRAPVAYLRAILENEHGNHVAQNGTHTTVDFSIEEIL